MKPITFVCETCNKPVEQVPRGNWFVLGRCQEHPRGRVVPEGATLVASSGKGLEKQSFSYEDVGYGNRARLNEIQSLYAYVRRRLNETEGTAEHRGFHAACMCLYFRCLALQGEERRDHSDFTPEHDAGSERKTFIHEMRHWQRSGNDDLAASLRIVLPEIEEMLLDSGGR